MVEKIWVWDFQLSLGICLVENTSDRNKYDSAKKRPIYRTFQFQDYIFHDPKILLIISIRAGTCLQIEVEILS